MKHRRDDYSRPHRRMRMVPFHIQLRCPSAVQELVAAAQDIIGDEQQPVLAAIQNSGTVFGGVLSADEHFRAYPLSCEVELADKGSLITGFAPLYSKAGLLVMPAPQDTSYVTASSLADLVYDEPGHIRSEGQEVTVVWGHYSSGRQFVVDTFPGFTTTVRLPDSPKDLKAHFSPLATQLSLRQCWILHQDQRIYHISWSEE